MTFFRDQGGFFSKRTVYNLFESLKNGAIFHEKIIVVGILSINEPMRPRANSAVTSPHLLNALQSGYKHIKPSKSESGLIKMDPKMTQNRI